MRFLAANRDLAEKGRLLYRAAARGQILADRRDFSAEAIVQLALTVQRQPDDAIFAVDPQLCIAQPQPHIRQRQRTVILGIGKFVEFAKTELAVFQPSEQLYPACPNPVDTHTTHRQTIADFDQFGGHVRIFRITDHQIANDLFA